MSNEIICVWLFIRIELIFSFLSPVFVWLYPGRPREITIIFGHRIITSQPSCFALIQAYLRLIQ